MVSEGIASRAESADALGFAERVQGFAVSLRFLLCSIYLASDIKDIVEWTFWDVHDHDLRLSLCSIIYLASGILREISQRRQILYNLSGVLYIKYAYHMSAFYH
jgi:hypothetical protein